MLFKDFKLYCNYRINNIINYRDNYIIIVIDIDMANRKISERHIRSLNKTAGGRSYIITLPIDEIESLGWKSKQKLVVKRYGEGLIIQDWKSSKDQG